LQNSADRQHILQRTDTIWEKIKGVFSTIWNAIKAAAAWVWQGIKKLGSWIKKNTWDRIFN